MIIVDDQDEADMNLDSVDLVICIGNYSLIKVPLILFSYWSEYFSNNPSGECANYPRTT